MRQQPEQQVLLYNPHQRSHPAALIRTPSVGWRSDVLSTIDSSHAEDKVDHWQMEIMRSGEGRSLQNMMAPINFTLTATLFGKCLIVATSPF